MTATTSCLIPGRREWEMLRCVNPSCEHERVRAVGEHTLTLPCGCCHCEMEQLPMAVVEQPARNVKPGSEFTLETMRTTLEFVARHQSEFADAAVQEGNKLRFAEHAGRCAAFREVLKMLDALGEAGR